MSRIRAIKPEFFRHEDLFDAERATKLPLRLAFSGLWTVADREGRFQWRPRAIKPDVLPYDNVDFTAIMDALAEHGFIIRYEADGEHYGYIPNFKKHQHVNVREAQSILPDPALHMQDTAMHVHARGEGKGREQEEEGNIPPYSPPKGGKPKRARNQLPANFPSEALLEQAAKFWEGKSRFDLIDDIGDQADQFRDYHLKLGSTMADWDAAWRTWYRNALKYNRKVNGHDGQRKSTGHDNFLKGALAFAGHTVGNTDSDEG